MGAKSNNRVVFKLQGAKKEVNPFWPLHMTKSEFWSSSDVPQCEENDKQQSRTTMFNLWKPHFAKSTESAQFGIDVHFESHGFKTCSVHRACDIKLVKHSDKMLQSTYLDCLVLMSLCSL